MLCRKNTAIISGCGSVPVYLNVYDLTSINGYAYWFGLGVYHSGLEVHGIEYAYGAHEYPTTGIFEGEPRQCDGFVLRKSILMGWTEMPNVQVRRVMEELSEFYKGNSYNLITKNCNHFCNDACLKLTGNRIPSWVNRLAKIGFVCKCIVPANLNSTRVGHHMAIEESKPCAQVEKLRTITSVTFTPPSNSSPSEESTTTTSGSKSNQAGWRWSNQKKAATTIFPVVILMLLILSSFSFLCNKFYITTVVEVSY